MKEKQRITGADIIQTRALETRERILMAALRLYADKGYHNTTVDEVAKSTGLSVGTAYRYFKDKKELLLAALTYGFTHVAEFVNVSETDLTNGGLEQALLAFEDFHGRFRALHEELEGLRHADADVAKLYHGFTENALKRLHAGLPAEMRERAHSFEDLRIAVGIMENHCHFCMKDQPAKEDLAFSRQRTIELVKFLLQGQ